MPDCAAVIKCLSNQTAAQTAAGLELFYAIGES